MLSSRALNLPCNVKRAMSFDHFTPEEVNDRALQRRVMRCQERMRPVLPHTIDLKKPGPAATGELTGLTIRYSTRVLEQTISESNNNNETTIRVGSGTNRTIDTGINTFNDDIVSLVNITAARADGALVAKHHRTDMAVHSIMVHKYHNKEAIELTYIAATQQIMHQRGHVPKKETHYTRSIVEEFDRAYDTSLTAEMTR